MRYVIVGIVGGIVAGMGMGGGTLTIPLLTIFMSVAQKTAQGINLLGFIPLAIVALIIHTKNKLVAYKKVWILAVVGMITGVGSALLVSKMSNDWLRRLFAIFLIVLAVWQLIQAIKDSKKKSEN
ncbi:MAG: TSUP family transporter [Clostridia bacterium]